MVIISVLKSYLANVFIFEILNRYFEILIHYSVKAVILKYRLIVFRKFFQFNFPPSRWWKGASVNTKLKTDRRENAIKKGSKM